MAPAKSKDVPQPYLHGDFGELPAEIAGRRVVRSLAPEKWPYPPEPDCQEEWDELDE